ncbi:MAG: transcriptional regulator Spx [Bacilli bacterium]|nr:transcriptional regulator Spx [Bacilli bacterium]
MIKIYTSSSCSSCRKVKKWFDEQKIPYVERNIFAGVLNPQELKDILSKTENGTDDIISKRSNVIKNGNVDIDSMTTNEFIEFVRQNPSCLKRPIIIDDRKIQVGYNSEEIRSFIPRARRIAEQSCKCSQTCESCPEIKEDFEKYLQTLK